MGLSDIAGMMKNLPQMMSKVGEMQEKMKSIRVEGRAGGGMVTVEMNGAGEVISVNLDPEVVDKEDVEMLQDLIVAACADAKRAVAEKAQSEIASSTGIDPSMFGLKM